MRPVARLPRCPCPRGRVRNRQEKTWGSKQGGWRGVPKIAWETGQGAGWLYAEGAHLAARQRAGLWSPKLRLRTSGGVYIVPPKMPKWKSWFSVGLKPRYGARRGEQAAAAA